MANLEAALEKHPRHSDLRYVKTLLYHRDWYIRREAAFLVDRFGISLSEEERWQYAYALQNFAYLVEHKSEQPRARKLLFDACVDPSPRFRSRILNHLSLSDCQTVEEEVRLHYAAGDYQTLIELGSMVDYREAVVQLLQFGLQEQNNPDYHRKQCAFCLEQLKVMEDAESFIRSLVNAPDSVSTAEEIDSINIEGESDSPLQQLIQFLNRQGIRIDEHIVHPEIQIGSVTNRITYRQPPLQTWDAEERRRRIRPEEGKVLIPFDYRAMEPTLLLHFLVSQFYLGLEDIPQGDIYEALAMENRSAAKQWLNAVINGGGRRYTTRLNPFQMKLLETIQEFRQELMEEATMQKAVETIGGNRIPITTDEPNFAGKVMNRLIQGSASDLFNDAVLNLHHWFTENQIPGRVYFLLFDEVWVELPRQSGDGYVPEIKNILEGVNHKFQLYVPLTVRHQILKHQEGRDEPQSSI